MPSRSIHRVRRFALLITPLFGACLPLAAQDAAGSGGSTALYGTVYSGAGRPLEGVVVRVDSGGLSARTDAKGDFRLTGVPPGPHLLVLVRDGFVPRSFRFTLPASAPAELDLGAIQLDARPDSTTAVSGVVLDARTRDSIPAAILILDDTLTVTTDPSGRFFIWEVRPGLHYLKVRRIGYEETAMPLQVPEGHVGVELTVELSAIPVDLPEVVVEGDRTFYAFGKLRGFYQRRDRGFGHFITRDEIVKRLPRVVTDVLRGVPRLDVRPGPLGNRIVTVSDASPNCRSPTLFLDGTELGQGNIDELINPQDVAGVEIYARPAEIPVEFNPTRASPGCGVIVIWTR
jgi:hypothetical protein